ncbi:ras-related protein Rab-39B-like [Oppia nitens]|uniref:ras-related protein Rab-39B-like n=1 Tax=Oppia nitens TaxID=1686743 RepID=UPI0023DA0D92|nr:ras-related protein Rab-39B-like [Oppia nitens]
MVFEAPFDYQFRLILIGDSTVGKSTLLRVFTDCQFTTWSDPTVGVDFFAKIITIRNGRVRIKLQLWDTAGQEKFRSITRSYYRNSVGALLLYDMTRRSTFEHLSDWLLEARRHIDPSRVVYQVVSCKSDMLDDREVTAEEGKTFAEFYGLDFIETSAKNQYNVDETFRRIAENIYNRVESGQFAMEEGWEGIKKGSPISANGISLTTADAYNNNGSAQLPIANGASNWCCY